jgi:hypothetical protein
MKENQEHSIEGFTTKQDTNQAKSELGQEISLAKSELKQEIALVRSELKQEIALVRKDINVLEHRLVIKIFALLMLAVGAITWLDKFVK